MTEGSFFKKKRETTFKGPFSMLNYKENKKSRQQVRPIN